jgi:hypothetical protein
VVKYEWDCSVKQNPKVECPFSNGGDFIILGEDRHFPVEVHEVQA